MPEEGSGLQIEFDDKSGAYVNDWGIIDVVQIDGWDAGEPGELGIQLTGGPGPNGPNAPLLLSGGESPVEAAGSSFASSAIHELQIADVGWLGEASGRLPARPPILSPRDVLGDGEILPESHGAKCTAGMPAYAAITVAADVAPTSPEETSVMAA